MMVPPNTLANAAVRPSSRLVVMGCMRICKTIRCGGTFPILRTLGSGSVCLTAPLPKPWLLPLSTKDPHILHQLVADLDAVVPYRCTHCLVVTDSKQGGSSVTQEEERVKGPGVFLRLAAKARGQLG